MKKSHTPLQVSKIQSQYRPSRLDRMARKKIWIF